MASLFALLLVPLLSAPPSAGDGDGDAREREAEVAAEAEPSRARAGLHRWLTRALRPSVRFLDHGVLALAVAGGTPHRYRLDLRVGLLDVLSLGLTTHWLPGQSAPQVWPVAALAFYRGRMLEIGGHYRPVLYPPVDPQRHFVPRTHMALGSFVLGSGWFSAALDVGAAHDRVAMVDPNDTLHFRPRTVFAGGVALRVGNRRWGLGADALAVLGPDTLLVFEAAVDLRFGAFEARPRTAWGRRPDR